MMRHGYMTGSSGLAKKHPTRHRAEGKMKTQTEEFFFSSVWEDNIRLLTCLSFIDSQNAAHDRDIGWVIETSGPSATATPRGYETNGEDDSGAFV